MSGLWLRTLARGLRVPCVAACLVVLGAACLDSDDSAAPSDEGAALGDGVAAAQQPEVESYGTVEIGDLTYDFTVACEASGAGEVTIIGTSAGTAGSGMVELYVQAFLAEPYIGLRLADGTLVEPSLDSSLDLYLQDDVVRASAIRFVRDLDLETGEATELGFGGLEIHCNSYDC